MSVTPLQTPFMAYCSIWPRAVSGFTYLTWDTSYTMRGLAFMLQVDYLRRPHSSAGTFSSVRIDAVDVPDPCG